MGGEKERLSRCAAWAEGSPPRGRGKAAIEFRSSLMLRITPAWAGKSRSFIRFHFFGKDHPRVGGEKGHA